MVIKEWATEIVPKENLAKFLATKIEKKALSEPINIGWGQHTANNSLSVPIHMGRVGPEPEDSAVVLMWVE